MYKTSTEKVWERESNMIKKIRQGFFHGMIATIGGTVLAMNAQSIAFMGVKSYPALRSNTSYAVQEYIL